MYGAGYTDHFRIVHKRATTAEERDEFKGSNYVQSDLTGVFRQVKKDLQDGLMIMFFGTPCQTAGLASYIVPTHNVQVILHLRTFGVGKKQIRNLTRMIREFL